ncbi:sensor histidine kinase [Caloranaerobacter azorensis]|uniref:sensor histidine kinase n=1 Tax=Caloranaerobacter azorensis TaxID=116090 RepID=UPI00093215C7|nr:HAMP domain-containing sensor histidine kinase [Caloranaerobacter azorensis]
MSRFLNNPEVKRIIIKLIAFQIILTILVFYIINIRIDNLKNNMIDNNIAVIGKILSIHPELEEEIIGYFTGRVSDVEMKKGMDIASKYHFTKELPIEVFSYLYNFEKNFYIIAGIFLFLSLAAILFIVLIEYKNIFRKVNIISQKAEDVVNGEIEALPEDGEGDFSILYHNFNNMTNRLKLTIEALDREKIYLKDIISDISHQLKTPLSSLIILNDIMLTRDIDRKKREEFLYKSREQLERMQWLIINLLKLAKMEVGAVKFNYYNENIIDTIKGSVSLLKPTIDKKNQQITIDTNKDNIVLKHDSEWLKEAFVNIIKNSSEHTPDNGRISISIDDTPVFTKVIIEDTGEGIKREELPNIFKRFYKASNAKSDSIGIGLSLAKTIIESHGGEIWVESKEGEGTRFIITFLKI